MTRKILYTLILIAVGALFALCGCDSAKQCQKAYQRAVKGGCLKVGNDTVIKDRLIKGDSVYVKVKVGLDSATLDSILNSKTDTCFTKEDIKEITKYVPCKIAPYHKDTATYLLDIKVLNGSLNVYLKIKDRIVKDTCISTNTVNERKVEVVAWWVKWVFILMLVALLWVLMKK